MSEEARKREEAYYAGTLKDDYISRKAVLDKLTAECGSCADTGYIFSLPGIEGEEPKMGKWKKAYLPHEYMGCRPTAYYCSECNQITTFRTFYCPNCGARMEEE